MASDSALILKVINVRAKEGIANRNLDTIAILTIEVSSPIVGTKPLRYDIELDGFVSHNIAMDFHFYIVTPSRNWNFTIHNKANIFPSKFEDMNLIKVILIKDKYIDTRLNNVNLLRTTIDEAMKITFIPNDVTGVLKIKMQLGYTSNTKIIKITGFKTTSS